MIEHLTVPQAAYFYRKKRSISKAAINNLFTSLRANTGTTSQNIFRVDREIRASSTYSAICFQFSRCPTFLKRQSGATEHVFGFLMMVESGDLVAVVKSGLQLPSDFKTEYLDRIGEDEVEGAIAQQDAVFEMIQLKNMSSSKHSLRTKRLEARDLKNVVATSSASRFVSQGFKVRRTNGMYSATPSTGRISTRADRTGCEGLVDWASEIMTLLAADNGAPSPFIRNFARPINLATISNNNIIPTHLLVDVPTILTSLFDEQTIRFVRESGGKFHELQINEINSILEEIDSSYQISQSLQVIDPQAHEDVGSIKINKSRISLSRFAASTASIFVEDSLFQVGEDQDRVLLHRYIDRENLFTILFSDYTLAYIDGTLYRDEGLLNGGKNFLAHFSIEAELSHTDSEKGDFSNNQKEFSEKSVFRVLVDRIAKTPDVLICDDLGDEWADFISIDIKSGSPTLTFYHAKHGDSSLSASAFHDSVGQAMKNLGRMDLPPDAMASKLRSWEKFYRNDGKATKISKILSGGTSKEIGKLIDDVRGSPGLIKQVLIVTSSISYSLLEKAFTDAAKGQQPTPHFVQLYWLLNAYFSACSEVGAVGYVVCQP